jgi:hypothetical protein
MPIVLYECSEVRIIVINQVLEVVATGVVIRTLNLDVKCKRTWY